jgi:hypothetical protein
MKNGDHDVTGQKGRHDTHHNDSRPNNTWYNGAQHNDTQQGTPTEGEGSVQLDPHQGCLFVKEELMFSILKYANLNKLLQGQL